MTWNMSKFGPQMREFAPDLGHWDKLFLDKTASHLAYLP